ncbi:MAG: galactose-1-phosphate uridylyltransferase [Ilumatobacteraceae bacterium]
MESAQAESIASLPDERVDSYLGTTVHVVGSRQSRPNLPSVGCPFCPGGLESPDPYDVRWFSNRWPAMPGDRCEVVLYTSQHDATLQSLGVAGVAKVIDLWTARTTELGARDDVDFVLVFENRGAEVGATIAHPHGQIYAYDHVPERPARLFAAGWQPDHDPGRRAVSTVGSWHAYVPFAPTYPVELVLAPKRLVPNLAELTVVERLDLAGLLVDSMTRLDRLYGAPLPYMMWLMQRPTTATAESDHPDAWFHIEIVSPWRARGVSRFIAAAEVAGGEYFNPVSPEDLAERLRHDG